MKKCLRTILFSFITFSLMVQPIYAVDEAPTASPETIENENDKTEEQNPDESKDEDEKEEEDEPGEEGEEGEEAEKPSEDTDVDKEQDNEQEPTAPEEADEGIDTLAEVDPVEAFITRFYKYCLNRDPDAEGLANWVKYIKSGGGTGVSTAVGFFNSEEFKKRNVNDTEFVVICYKTFLDREPDPEGLTHWEGYLEKGTTRQYVIKGIGVSQEFSNLCKKYGITRGDTTLTSYRDKNINVTGFVARLYKEILGRQFDGPGIEHQCKYILSKTNQKTAAREVATSGFLHSAEFLKKNTTNDEYVTILYKAFLGRGYDSEGYKFWMAKLNRGESRDSIAAGFANSKEFSNIINGYGLTETTNYTPTYYSQRDGRWSGVRYNGYSLSSTGCVPTSVAMAVDGILHNGVNPKTAADYLVTTGEFAGRKHGGSGLAIKYGAEHWGLKTTGINNYNTLVNCLNNGNIVIFQVGAGTFTSRGTTHAIVLFRNSGGNTYVYDPLNIHNGWYSISSIWSQRSGSDYDWTGGYVGYGIYR